MLRQMAAGEGDGRCLQVSWRRNRLRETSARLQGERAWLASRCAHATDTRDGTPKRALLTRLHAWRFVGEPATRDRASGSRAAGLARCCSIHPAPRARVHNGRALSRAHGSQRAETSSKAPPDLMIGNQAPGQHSGQTADCGRDRFPTRDGRLGRFAQPRYQRGQASAALRARSG
jgi:hypothetical protein